MEQMIRHGDLKWYQKQIEIKLGTKLLKLEEKTLTFTDATLKEMNSTSLLMANKAQRVGK